jgi:hypothetical protein
MATLPQKHSTLNLANKCERNLKLLWGNLEVIQWGAVKSAKKTEENNYIL